MQGGCSSSNKNDFVFYERWIKPVVIYIDKREFGKVDPFEWVIDKYLISSIARKGNIFVFSVIKSIVSFIIVSVAIGGTFFVIDDIKVFPKYFKRK